MYKKSKLIIIIINILVWVQKLFSRNINDTDFLSNTAGTLYWRFRPNNAINII